MDKTKAANWLVGQCMKKLGKEGHPETLKQLIQSKLPK